jgi:DNA-binding transcriptional regulator WhiA
MYMNNINTTTNQSQEKKEVILWEESKNTTQTKKSDSQPTDGEWNITSATNEKKDEKPSTDTIKRKHPNHFHKYEIDFSKFETKNTEEFAYFLGFFYADGYNDTKSGKINISLKESDSPILERFSNLFFGNRPIYHYTVKCQTNDKNKICVLTISNGELSNLMSSLGAPERKTFKIRFPMWLDKSLWKHFIRGYFDGDGSLMKSKSDYRISIASNLEFNTQLQLVIKELTGLEFGITKHGKICVLYKGGNNNTMKFLNWLYSDSNIYLQRKYDRYQEFIIDRNIKCTKPHHVYLQHSGWVYRLPSKLGGFVTSGFTSKEDAFEAYKLKLIELNYNITDSSPNSIYKKSPLLYKSQ